MKRRGAGRLVAVVLLLCATCGGQAHAGGRCRRTLLLGVDSLFTKRERAEIAVAVANWTAASGGQVCFRIAPCDTSAEERTHGSDGEFTIYSWKRPWQLKAAGPCAANRTCLAITATEPGGRAADIFVIEKDIRYLRATIEHEMGHVLGMKHTPIFDSIMFPKANAAKTIANVDREALACLMANQSLIHGADRCAPEALRPALARNTCVDPVPSEAPKRSVPPTADDGGAYEALVARGQALSEQGRVGKAFRTFERAARLRPDRVEALTGMAYSRLDQERFDLARATFRRALALAPGNADALIGMAETFKIEGDNARAIACYQAYLAEHSRGTMAAVARRNVADLEQKVAGDGMRAPTRVVPFYYYYQEEHSPR